jgi:hypothetical protein
VWEDVLELVFECRHAPAYCDLLRVVFQNDPLRSALVSAASLSVQFPGFAKANEVVEALVDPDSAYAHSRPHQDVLLSLLAHASQSVGEDEKLRVMGREIGIDSDDQVCHVLVRTHAFYGRDARAIECFALFESEADKTACASEVLLKVLKLRVVMTLREAAKTEKFAAALAQWNPKTTAWLTSSGALVAARDAQEAGLCATSTLRSTHRVLATLQPSLPVPLAPAQDIPRVRATTSHSERCTELATLLEALLAL